VAGGELSDADHLQPLTVILRMPRPPVGMAWPSASSRAERSTLGALLDQRFIAVRIDLRWGFCRDRTSHLPTDPKTLCSRSVVRAIGFSRISFSCSAIFRKRASSAWSLQASGCSSNAVRFRPSPTFGEMSHFEGSLRDRGGHQNGHQNPMLRTVSILPEAAGLPTGSRTDRLKVRVRQLAPI
jgi:hypothetical protein